MESRSVFERLFMRLQRFDKSFDERVELMLLKLIALLRHLFIGVMVLYLAVCIMSLSHKIISLTLTQGALDFPSIKMILTDGLFTLIVMAIVKTFFIRDTFEYAFTLLGIGFVVIIRKLILLETIPEEAPLMWVLSATSVLFFLLILLTQFLKNRKSDEMQADEAS